MKYYGKIGFMYTEETDPVRRPGIFEEVKVEKRYSGEHVSPFSGSWRSGSKLNDDKTISTKISILADPFAQQHFNDIRYVWWLGKTWEVSNVEVQFPRLVLNVGDLYNAPEDE